MPTVTRHKISPINAESRHTYTLYSLLNKLQQNIKYITLLRITSFKPASYSPHTLGRSDSQVQNFFYKEPAFKYRVQSVGRACQVWSPCSVILPGTESTQGHPGRYRVHTGPFCQVRFPPRAILSGTEPTQGHCQVQSSYRAILQVQSPHRAILAGKEFTQGHSVRYRVHTGESCQVQSSYRAILSDKGSIRIQGQRIRY
jgi:hypothetical protein